MTKESFLRGAFILAAASSVSRVVGIIYMVVLPRIIFDEGMGLYQLVKPIYYFAAVIAISGIPVAVSKLVAEKAAQRSRAGVLRVLRLGMVLMTITGSIAALVMVGGASFLAEHVAKDPGVFRIIVFLGPAAFFLAISAGLRGFFHGMQHMAPTAISQITDQVIRVGATVIMAIAWMPRGVEWGTAGAALGSVLGEFSGTLVLVGFYFWQRNSLMEKMGSSRTYLVDQDRWGALIKRMAALAFPVVIATVLWPVMQMADTVLIPMRMQVAGFSPEQVRDWVGYLGMALTISQFPNIVTVALATSLVPAISEAYALGSRTLISKRTQEAVRVAVLFGLPSFAGLYVLAEPISSLLFGYLAVGEPLRILAIGTLTLGLIQATTGVLQGLGLVMIPVRNLCIGVLVKFICNYVFIANPEIGVLGAAWGSTAGWTVAAILNLLSVFRRVGFAVHFTNNIFKPAAASLALGVFIYYIHDTTNILLTPLIGGGASNAFGTILAIILGMSLYFLLLMIIGSITSKDLNLIPRYGKHLAEFFYSWGFLRK